MEASSGHHNGLLTQSLSRSSQTGPRKALQAVIYLQSIDEGDATALTSADNEANISKFSWSPDGIYIAYLSPDEKSPERKAKEERKDDPEVHGEN